MKKGLSKKPPSRKNILAYIEQCRRVLEKYEVPKPHWIKISPEWARIMGKRKTKFIV